MTRHTPLVLTRTCHTQYVLGARLRFEAVHATKHNFFISQCHRMCEVIKIALKVRKINVNTQGTQAAADVFLFGHFTFWPRTHHIASKLNYILIS